jgi:hypothetical protein
MERLDLDAGNPHEVEMLKLLSQPVCIRCTNNVCVRMN